jgi:hypothetical protein
MCVSHHCHHFRVAFAHLKPPMLGDMSVAVIYSVHRIFEHCPESCSVKPYHRAWLAGGDALAKITA